MKNEVISIQYPDFSFKYFYLRALIKDDGQNSFQRLVDRINFYNSKIFWDSLYFGILLTLGICQFVGGSILWYVKIQIPQDKILKMQLAESEAKAVKGNVASSRKHFEPKVLPRPKARNLR